MAAETLRSEFLFTLSGFVGPPRDIGTTPRGTRYSNAASRPLSDADLMASTRRCRSIAVSNVGWWVSPSRIARAKRVYI